MRRIVLAVAFLFALGVGQAQAAYIGSTPATNDVLGITEGYFDADLYLVAGGPIWFDVEFIGKEAGFTNRFYLDGNLLVTTGVTAPGFVGSVLINPGLIPFYFTVNGGGPVAVNGANVSPATNLPNFYTSLSWGGPIDTVVDGNTPGSGNVFWLALDDAGAGPDDNHDDLVVKITLREGQTNVPDGGATLAMLGGALLGLRALRRRFNA